MTTPTDRAARPVTPIGIVAQLLDQLLLRMTGDAPVDPGLTADLRAARDLVDGLDPYLARCTTPESAPLRRLAAATRATDWSHREDATVAVEQEMLSGHVEGQLLKMLVHATRATQVLEIGMFTGYSALAMAEALPVGGRLVACELDPGIAAFAKALFDGARGGDRIVVEVGPALQTMRALAAAGDAFDLVFLDADKAGYADYVATLLDTGLLAPHGLLCIDNTLMQGQPWTGTSTPNGAAISEFNRALSDDRRVEQVVLPLRDGLTLVRRVALPCNS